MIITPKGYAEFPIFKSLKRLIYFVLLGVFRIYRAVFHCFCSESFGFDFGLSW